jgi:predicted dehydrogenase
MNILIIGYGSIAKKHVVALGKLGITELNIYAYRSTPGNDLGKEIINVYTFDKVKSIKFDFIIISNPTIHHFDTIKKVLHLNTPLFIEKPVIHNLENSSILESQIIRMKLKTYVGCNLRFHTCIDFVKKQLPKKIWGKVEEVNAYCGSYLPDWRPNRDYKKVYSSHADQGGGAHLDLIHELDYLYYLFGNPKKIQRTLKSKSSLAIHATDYAHYLLEYSDFVASTTLNYFRKLPKRQLEIVCKDSIINVDLIKNTVTENNEIIFEDEENNLSSTYEKQMKYFINYINGEDVAFNTFSEGLAVLKICLANE